MLRQNNLIQGSAPTLERKQRNKKTKLLSTTLVFTIICGDLLFVTGALVYHLFNQWVEANQTISPTEIPWIKTEEECEHTRRIWKNGECLDIEHNHLF